MGGGGSSSTTTQIPESLQRLWNSTTNQITPIQQQMWAPTTSGWKKDGQDISQGEYDKAMSGVTDAQTKLQQARDAFAAYHQGKGASPEDIANALAKGESPEYTAAQKALTQAQEATKAYTATTAANPFTQQQGYEQYYGKPGEGANIVPDTAKAAMNQALGTEGQPGFVEESKWTNPAAAAAMGVANTPGVGAEFTQARPAGVAGWNDEDLRLANYAGVGGTQFTNPQSIGNPDPYAPKPQMSQKMPSNLFQMPGQAKGGQAGTAGQFQIGTQAPQQVTTKQETPAGSASQTVKYNQPQAQPSYSQQASQGGSYKPQAAQNTPAVQSTGNAAGWMDTTKPAYEQGYVSQANQLQNIGSGTPNLEQMARSTQDPNSMAGNAMKIWANTKLPTIQNQAAMMGLGRSGALIKNIDSSQNQFLMPLMQQQLDYENQAIGRAQQGASQNVSALQAASQAQQGREAQDYSRNMEQANMIRAQEQAQLDAQNQDFLRRQQLSQQGNQQQAANLATAGGMFQGLGQADTTRQMQGANQLMGMAQTEKDWAAQPGDFAYQEFLRTQGLGENMLFQPLGGAASAIGTKTSGGGK